MTWNVRGSKHPDLDAVADVVREAHADVVCFQEILEHQARGLVARLGGDVHWGRKHSPFGPFLRRRAEGLAVWSRGAVDERSRSVLSRRVPSFVYLYRVLVAATATVDEHKLRVYNVHLATTTAAERIAQANRLLTVVDRESPSATLIVAGDFNGADEVALIERFATIGLHDPGGHNTSPATEPYQRIDFVLIPDDATEVSSATPPGGDTWAKLSDHLPVTVTFTEGPRSAPSSDGTPSR